MSAALFKSARAVLVATLGACGMAALDVAIRDGLRPAWEPHADGLVCVGVHPAARGGGAAVVARRATRGARGEALALAVLPGGAAYTEAHMRDWDLGAAWAGAPPAGHESLLLRDQRGRRVTLIAPAELLPPVASYVAYMVQVLDGVALTANL